GVGGSAAALARTAGRGGLVGRADDDERLAAHPAALSGIDDLAGDDTLAVVSTRAGWGFALGPGGRSLAVEPPWPVRVAAVDWRTAIPVPVVVAIPAAVAARPVNATP